MATLKNKLAYALADLEIAKEALMKHDDYDAVQKIEALQSGRYWQDQGLTAPTEEDTSWLEI